MQAARERGKKCVEN